MTAGEEKTYRSLEVETFILASPSAVWLALTDPAELVRWFALEARVDPGSGGRLWLSWGEPIVSDSRIEIWEPGHRLRTAEVRPLGAKLQPQVAGAIERTVDYWIEPRPGGTSFRIVHSGFPCGEQWNGMYQIGRASCRERV